MQNRVFFNSESEAIQSGYRPCGKSLPFSFLYFLFPCTPNQKWAQSQWWSSDKQRGTGSALVLSRPDDAFEIINKNQPLCTSLEKTSADPYLGLSDDQHGDQLLNSNENSVQILGG